MSARARSARDTYRFSLAGVTTIAGFVAPPLIADDRIRQEPAEDGSAAAGEPAGVDDADGCDERPDDRRRAA